MMRYMLVHKDGRCREFDTWILDLQEPIHKPGDKFTGNQNLPRTLGDQYPCLGQGCYTIIRAVVANVLFSHKSIPPSVSQI